jgi:hypothetical protein
MKRMIIVGAIYLQSIVDKQLKGATRSNLDLFCLLSGTKGLVKVVLGTTKWDMVGETEGEKLERQLAEAWNAMTDTGSNLLRFKKTEESARAFLDVILCQLEFGGNEEILNDNVLRIQDWLMLLRRKFSGTKAGQVLLNVFKPKKDDNLMVDALPTDIVIPCDSIHRFLSHYHYLPNFSVMGPTGVGKSTVCSSLFRIAILSYDAVSFIVHQHSPRERYHARRRCR